MMPTFPPPPLKFRTVGFPQYGFKASLSDPACPGRREVKPAPGMPSGLGGFAVILGAPPDYVLRDVVDEVDLFQFRPHRRFRDPGGGDAEVARHSSPLTPPA